MRKLSDRLPLSTSDTLLRLPMIGTRSLGQPLLLHPKANRFNRRGRFDREALPFVDVDKPCPQFEQIAF